MGETCEARCDGSSVAISTTTPRTMAVAATIPGWNGFPGSLPVSLLALDVFTPLRWPCCRLIFRCIPPGPTLISPRQFYDSLLSAGVEFFTGVPDSLLKGFCSTITCLHPQDKHLVAANEGTAIGLAAGYHLGSGTVPVVYLQNSGIGNSVNPLASLADPSVYGFPLILVVGWRAEVTSSGEQICDEPQHIKQGCITLSLLEVLDIPYRVLGSDVMNLAALAREFAAIALQRQGPVALVVRRGLFSEQGDSPPPGVAGEENLTLSRQQAISRVADKLPDSAVVVATTGKASRELFEHRLATDTGGERDFLVCGSMGHASQIAVGLAVARPDRVVCCLDGDGAAIMHLGGMTSAATVPNMIHVVLNNGCHDSVGGQASRGFEIDFPELARAMGYPKIARAKTVVEIDAFIDSLVAPDSFPAFLEIQVRRGSRPDLGRPTLSPAEMKIRLMRELSSH